MKSSILLTIPIFFFLSSLDIKAQNHIQEKCYEGYIFNEDTKSSFIEYSLKRFKPSKREIETVEKELKVSIKEINHLKPNQGRGCPIIHKKIKRYNRQYLGYIDNNGHRIILINFIWKKETPENWDKQIIEILDGCSFYWNIKIDLESMTFFDFRVNGRS